MKMARDTSDDFSTVVPNPPIPTLLQGQKALVTGASSGIGQGIAVGLAQAGADVLINYFNDEDGARETLKMVQALGREGDIVHGDVSKEDDVLNLYDRMAAAFDRIDILVSNAGMQKDAPLTEMSDEDWRRVIDVNLTGSFLTAREAVKCFHRQGINDQVSRAAGKIIFISSVHEVIAWAGHANYNASKGGLHMLMVTLAQELAEDQIRVNSIAPGAIATAINRHAWEDSEARRDLEKKIPYGRVGTVVDVARVAAWLASDQADYMTGATLFVDGGMTQYPSFREGG